MLRIINAQTFAWMLAAAIIFSSSSIESSNAQELDPQQKQWTKKYLKQKNAPKLEEMLLNTDSEPDLSEGFTSLFNGTDLSGWQSKGGSCTFEVKDGVIVGTCVPGSDSTTCAPTKPITRTSSSRVR